MKTPQRIAEAFQKAGLQPTVDLVVEDPKPCVGWLAYSVKVRCMGERRDFDIGVLVDGLREINIPDLLEIEFRKEDRATRLHVQIEAEQSLWAIYFDLENIG